MKRRIAAILLTLSFFLSGFSNAYAFQVFPSTGHKCREQLLNLESYAYVRKHADGWWMMPWNIRSGYLSEGEFQLIFSSFIQKNMVVEENDTHVDWEADDPDPIQLETAVNAGADIHTIMAYNEGLNGSVLTEDNIEKFKALYEGRYLLLSNVRCWLTCSKEALSELDGISFEFQIPEMDAGRWMQVANAVKWAAAHNKYIYLLTPPGHDDCDLNGTYIAAYKEFFTFLRYEVGDEILKSEKVIFVPSNYNYDLTNIQMTPESVLVNGRMQNANTVMGVAKWLLEQPLHASSARSEVPEQQNGKVPELLNVEVQRELNFNLQPIISLLLR